MFLYMAYFLTPDYQLLCLGPNGHMETLPIFVSNCHSAESKAWLLDVSFLNPSDNRLLPVPTV